MKKAALRCALSARFKENKLIVVNELNLTEAGTKAFTDILGRFELSNALVVSQHVRDGEVRLYYDDASGHEGLYHWLQAGTVAAFGPGVGGYAASRSCWVLPPWR